MTEAIEVVVNKTINAPASKAWKTLSSFRNIESISPIESSEVTGEGVGAERTCNLPNEGGIIYEVLNKVENSTMEMQYEITQGPFPIEGYISDIKVEALGDSDCKITWGSQFSTNEESKVEMINLFEGFYNEIISQLEIKIQNQN